MVKTVKKFGRVYTPCHIVNLILDFGGYKTTKILRRHVIDNSCGDGAFLIEIVNLYCTEFLKTSNDLTLLKSELQTYIHGTELDSKECGLCIQNLNQVSKKYGITDVQWDILNANTLKIDQFNGKMDFVFGNPPYVRVHNLENIYGEVKKFKFTEGGMTDLFIVFFEIGFKMLTRKGSMCLITPSSWLNSLAGRNLRKYILEHRNLSGVIDLEHYQPFEASTYTIISRFSNSKKHSLIEYFNYNEIILEKRFQDNLTYNNIVIGKNFYFSKKDNLELLKKIKQTQTHQHVTVKNGFATLADRIFIGDFDFTEGTIPILKASTGKWSKCIFPYNETGKPLTESELRKLEEVYEYLSFHQNKLSKNRDIEDDKYWYLFGRTQALKDVSKTKYAINTIIKDIHSIKLEVVPQGCGVYSGLYILTEFKFEIIRQLVYSEDFIEYIKLLKNYKSGGYYNFSSKDLEQYLNYKLTKEYGQPRIFECSRELF